MRVIRNFLSNARNVCNALNAGACVICIPTIFATGTVLACQKTPPPNELQIPATVTTLHHVIKACTYQLC